jgi:hypothetical protein
MKVALVGGKWSTARPCRFTPREKSTRYPLDRRLGEPQSQSGRHGEEKILDPSGTRTPTPRSARRYTDWVYPGSGRWGANRNVAICNQAFWLHMELRRVLGSHFPPNSWPLSQSIGTAHDRWTPSPTLLLVSCSRTMNIRSLLLSMYVQNISHLSVARAS